MFEQPETEWGSTSKGIYEIKHKLENKKVLLVADDVDERKQLENLAGGSDWFGPGSRIIITTIDKGLLMGTHPKKVEAYAMPELNDPQSVFLDIACFFKGNRIEYVEELLAEFSAESNIEELVNKSLLNVEDGNLYMHDLIQDMGREIVRQEAPNNPAKRSRLWLQQDVIDVLSANDSGCDAIQGIMLEPPEYTDDVYYNDSAFEKMNRLRILIVRRITFSSEPKHLPNHLRLLDWEKYPSNTFPPNFYSMKVIILNLCASQLTMKEPFKKFSYLTVVNITGNNFITTMPDVSKVENLRELRFDDCENLTTVHESIGFLKHLVQLSLSECPKLENFLQRMFLPSLKVLILYDCSKLEHFPDIVDKMDKPLNIVMAYTSIKKLPNSVGNLIGLVS